MRKTHLLLSVRRFTHERTNFSSVGAQAVARCMTSHRPPPCPPAAPSAPIPPDEQCATVLSTEAFRPPPGCATASPTSTSEDSTSIVTAFLQDVCFGYKEASGAQQATRSYCFARDMLPNLPESALYLVGRTEPFLKSAASSDGGREDGKVPTLSHPMQQLEHCVCEAAVWYTRRNERSGAAAVTPHQTVKQFLRDTSFVRSLLEQAFLSLYYCEERHTFPASGSQAVPKYTSLFADNIYGEYPAPLRSQLESALRVVLCESPFSFSTTFEQCVRGASRYPYRSTLSLEVFMLWWYCNADAFPVEKGSTSTVGRLCVPNFYATQYNQVNEHFEIQKRGTTPTTTASYMEERVPLADEALDIAIDHLLLQQEQQQSSAATSSSSPSSSPTCAVQSEGGFLHTHLLLPLAYRHAIRDLASSVPFKKYHITCSLLPRVMQVAAGLPPSARQRGVSILTQLCAWCRLALCEAPKMDRRPATASLPPSFNPFAEDPTQWVVLCCTMCAIARVEASRTALTLSLGGATQREALQAVQADYIKTVATLCAVATQSDDGLLAAAALNGATPLDESGLMWAHKLFHVVYQCFCESGCLDRLSVTKPLPHEKRPFLFYLLFTAVTRTFPHIFHGGATVSTLWAMCCIDNMASVPHSSVAKEMALLAWKQVVRAPGRDHDKSAQDEDASSFFHVIDSVEARQQEAAVLCGRLTPAKAEQRSVTPLLATAPSNVDVRASPLVNVERVRAAALCLFREHAQLPLLQPSPAALKSAPLSVARFSADDTQAVREDTLVRTVQPPSFYTWVRLMRLYAQLGDPATVTAADGRLMACLTQDIFPHCRPMMANYLRKIGLQSLYHGGQAGVLAMITRFNDEVDRLPPGLAWSYLLQGALWSCLPATVDFGHPATAASPQGKVDLACFGRGSFAWKLLEQNHKELFAPSEDTKVNAVSMNIRAVLSFLEHLARFLPQDMKQTVFLLPCVEQMKRCMELELELETQSSSEKGGENGLYTEQLAPEPELIGALAQEEYTDGNEGLVDDDDDDDVDGDSVLVAAEVFGGEEDALRLTEEDLNASGAPSVDQLPSTTARVGFSSTSLQKVSGVGNAEEEAEKSQDAPDNSSGAAEDAAKELQHALAWSPAAAQHVLLSMLDACYWICSTGETRTQRAAWSGIQGLEASATLCLHYDQLSSSFSCALFPKSQKEDVTALSPLLQSSSFVQTLCSILLGSCPEVYLLNQCLLLLLQRYLAEVRANPKVIFNRLLSLEEPMCQLLLYHGITLTEVRTWRDSAGMWSPQEQYNGGLGVLQRIRTSNSASVQHGELLRLFGSLALFSLEQRAKMPSTVLQQATTDAAYAREVLPSLQRLQAHSYHVQTFLAGGAPPTPQQQVKRDAISPARQVILPSQQLLASVNSRFVKSMKEVLPKRRHPHQKDVHWVLENRDASRSQTLHRLHHAFHRTRTGSKSDNNNNNSSSGLEDDFHSLIFEEEEATINRLFHGRK